MPKALPKILVFILCLLPFIFLVYDVLSGNMIDQIEEITNPTGQWALRFLLITLAITPIVKLTKTSYLMRFRRMLGLFSFFYVLLHLSIWLIDQSFDAQLILEDIIERTYITLGFTALMLLLPLSITSTNGWIKRLGGKRWKKLHRLVYIAAILACVHFYWQSKSALAFEPLIYAGILTVLLGFRVFKKFKKKALLKKL